MPKNTNDKLVDEILKHLIEADAEAALYAEEIGNEIERTVLPKVGKAIQGASFKGLTDKQKLFKIRNILAENADVSGLTGSFLVNLTAIGTAESGAVAKLFESVLPVAVDVKTVAPEQLQAVVMDAPYRGATLGEWFNDLSRQLQDGLQNDIKVALSEGKDITQIASDLLNRNFDEFSTASTKQALNHAKTIARTATNAVNTQAREMTYAENAEYIKGVQYIATLDDRTTARCIELHGTIWPIGEGPRPPQHWNCRSTTVPVAKSWEELGIPANEISSTAQASMNGQVSEVKSFEGWLKTQDSGVQNKLLGKAKAQLWREGKSGNLLDMIGPGGNFLTLRELGYDRQGKKIA